MNGSGNFPNDFIDGSVRCPRYGCEGDGRRRREHVHAGARRGVRDARRPAPGRRSGAAGHRSGAARHRRRARGADAAPGRLGGEPDADRRPRRGARGRRLRDRPTARGRSGSPLPGRDDPAPVRMHRPGDHRRRRVRQGVAHRSDGAGAGGGNRSPRQPRSVVRRLHEPDGVGDPGAAGRRSSRARALQRGDRVPAAVRGSLRRGARARAAGARRAQPSDVGAQGAGGRRRPVAGDPGFRDRPRRRRDATCRRS